MPRARLLSTGTAAILCAVLAGAPGCGVQADEGTSDACTELEPFLAIKTEADALDRKMLDLRPTEVTLASVKALSQRYQAASDEYDGFRDRAESELARAESADSDFTNVWELMVESLTIRRDGFLFFAETFANPVTLRDPSTQAEGEEWQRKTLNVNERVEESSGQWMREHGFEETEDGNFIVDC